MKTIGYFPGCSLSGTASEYDKSLRAVAAHLGFELKEVPEWLCCGASSAHAVDHVAALCLAADTLAKARRAKLDEVLAPCAMCYQRLATAIHEFESRPGLAASVAEALGEDRGLDMEVVRPLSLLDWLEELSEEQIKGAVVKPLEGLKVACYYGCLLVRPPRVTGRDDVEAPRGMERMIRLLGAEPVRWTMAMECCGGSFALSRKPVVLRQGRIIYQAAQKAGADVMCMACPMCHANLDMRQREYVSNGGGTLPMLYLTQLMGLAFGLSNEAMGFKGHFVAVEPTLEAALSGVKKDAAAG